MSGWTKTPNAILEAMPHMTEAELKLTAVLIRETYGRHKDEVRMTYDDMERLTKLSRPAIGRAITKIEERGFFTRGRKSMWLINSNNLLLNESNYSNNSELFEDENSNVELPYYSNNLLPSSIKEKKEEERNPPAPQTDEDPDLQTIWDEIQVTIAHFEKLTGIKRPYGQSEKAKARMSEDWITPAHDMKALANGRTEELMRQAVEEMTRERLTIGSPRSINTTFCRLHREAAQKTADNPHADMKSNGKGW